MCYIETVRIVQRLNDPKRESNGETTETARRCMKAAHSSKFVPRQRQKVRIRAAAEGSCQAAAVSSCPGSGRRFVPRQ